MGGLTCKKAKTPLDSYRANVEHCLHACTDCLLAPQTFPLLPADEKEKNRTITATALLKMLHCQSSYIQLINNIINTVC